MNKYIKHGLDRSEDPQQIADRMLYPDVARCAATIGVIVLHICGGMMWALTPSMWQFKWLATMDTMMNFVIGSFLMLSGMFLLSPEKQVTLSQLFRKYIFRLVIAYVIWSSAYAVFMAWYDGVLLAEGLHGLWVRFYNGHYHLWFLPMMIGVYLTTPFFRAITEKRNAQLLHYVFAILVFFNVFYPNSCSIFPTVSNIIERIDPSWFGIHATYFFAGYYFSRMQMSRSGKYIWLLVLFVSAIWFVYSVYAGSLELGMLDESQWCEDWILKAIYTVSVFMAFRNYGDKVSRFPKVCWFVRKLAGMSFTVYLCHDLFIKILARLGFHSLTWHPLISVPVLSVTVLSASIALCSCFSAGN